MCEWSLTLSIDWGDNSNARMTATVQTQILALSADSVTQQTQVLPFPTRYGRDVMYRTSCWVVGERQRHRASLHRFLSLICTLRDCYRLLQPDWPITDWLLVSMQMIGCLWQTYRCLWLEDTEEDQPTSHHLPSSYVSDPTRSGAGSWPQVPVENICR